MKEKTISTISEKDAEPLDGGCGRQEKLGGRQRGKQTGN